MGAGPAVTTATGLRAEFPVLSRSVYLNAGSFGPVPAAAARAAKLVLCHEATWGRLGRDEDGWEAVREDLRSAYARALGPDVRPRDVALTTGTTDGLARVLSAFRWGRDAEVVTAEDEHPGLLGQLAVLRRRGVRVRAAPLHRIHEAVTPATTLVACSHVAWRDGRTAPSALAELRGRVPVLLDGAQGAGAVPVDPAVLGCAFYAAPGQKWLCGPAGTGLLWIDPAWRDLLEPTGVGWRNLDHPDAGLDTVPFGDARAFDASASLPAAIAQATAAIQVLEHHGWPAVHADGSTLAARFAAVLAESGRDVAARDASTLVSFRDADPPATVARLADRGIDVRRLPGTDLVRASVGAWNDEDDLDRLVETLGAAAR
ncbi:aminotransferase class V-fold PLP-dependent enzyme [Patulibacter sp. NPDC049589]|uniref:aminotransferase class V-fold PLP-dependent enzyme n=1 Tax=Patulibacter sp. NPDC049589 TaxID=3154731 RepID=UPI003447E842